MEDTVGPRLLRRPGHVKYDAIFGVDAIFEGWPIRNVQITQTFPFLLSKMWLLWVNLYVKMNS